MTNQPQTAIDFFYDKIKSHFKHDGDLLETLNFTYAIAKEKEREQMNIAREQGTSNVITRQNNIESIKEIETK